MTPSQLTRTMNWIAMPVALILVAMVAYQIYQRHYLQQQSGTSYQFDDLPALDSPPVTANIDAMIDNHVFGVIPEALTSKPVVVEKQVAKPVPKTRLNIKLTGIIDGDSPENGIAMLEVDRGRTLVVAVGEKIGKTDATLHQVLPGEVLVDRDGTIESVKMVRKTLSLAKLDPTLMDSLPQPYIEQNQEPQKETQNYASGAPKSNPPSRTTSAYQPLADPADEAPMQVDETNGVKRLPIPRGLRKSQIQAPEPKSKPARSLRKKPG